MNYQHSAVRGNVQALTLPSVDGGFGTLNIMKDPPKSIHTRYKPKVSDTSKITEWIDQSGDRICENVKVYARGINPMVSVSYSNYGTNGGQSRDRSGQVGKPLSIASGQSYYPYLVNRDGAFRPPVIPPEQYLPLSRLPRLPTSQYTNPSNTNVKLDYEKLTQCNTNWKALRKDLLHVCAEPKAIFNIETPHSKPYEVDNAIASKVKYNMTANKNDPTRYKAGVSANNVKRAIKSNDHTLQGTISTNLYKNINTQQIQAFSGNQKIPVHDRVKGSVSVNKSGSGGETISHKPIERERNLPRASMHTNPGNCRVDKNASITSRQYHLPERTSRGGFSNHGVLPTTERQTEVSLRPNNNLQQRVRRVEMTR